MGTRPGWGKRHYTFRRAKTALAIARTMLLNPRILIMDDSASSVDTETEHFIRQALAELPVGRTTFIIAHRLRSVEMADLILVLKDGQVVERGRHQELSPATVYIARSTHYSFSMRRTYKKQLHQPRQ